MKAKSKIANRKLKIISENGGAGSESSAKRNMAKSRKKMKISIENGESGISQ